MEHSEIFFVLPELSDPNKECTSELLEYDSVMSLEDYEDIIRGLSVVKEFFNYENASFFIDGLNSKSFQETLDTLDDEDMYP